MTKKKFIPEIYNYCDRWCERCDFNDRCKLYYNEQMQLQKNHGNDDFVQIVTRNLTETLELIKAIAEEKGIDFDAPSVDNEELTKEEVEDNQKFNTTIEHPLAIAAQEYTNETDEWLKGNEYLEDEKVKLFNNIELGIHLDESDKALRIIDDALSVIEWYQIQISVKICSAVRCFLFENDLKDKIQNMHNAYAKIALIGIENSMHAWRSLMNILSDEQDFILDRLLQLKQVKKNMLVYFPFVQQFKRPGFDD